MKRTHLYAIPILSAFFLILAMASCRMPNNPKPPATDTCCHGKMMVHVTDANGKAQPGAPVSMTGPDGKVIQGKADANGNVVFEGLCPGKYSLSTPSRDGTRSEPKTVQMGCNDRQEVKLVTGTAPPPPPPPPPPPGPADSCCHGILHLHVVDANGNPIANAPVTISGGNGTMKQAKTDANGNVMFDGLCDGTYKVNTASANSPQGGTTTVVTMGCNDRKEMKLVTGNNPPPPPPPPTDSCCNGRLVIDVFDGNGNPIAGAPVTIKSSNGQVTTVPSNANGQAVFEHLCDGSYSVTTTTQDNTGASASGATSVRMDCNDSQETKLVVAKLIR